MGRIKLFAIVVISSIGLFFTSCTDKNQVPPPKMESELNYQFKASHQVDAVDYRILVSTDYKNWEEVLVILPSENNEDRYNVNVDITKYFGRSNIVYSKLSAKNVTGTVWESAPISHKISEKK
jgi:hypothetical protein